MHLAALPISVRDRFVKHITLEHTGFVMQGMEGIALALDRELARIDAEGSECCFGFRKLNAPLAIME